MAGKPLEGKVAIVTGAASPIGLGRAITLAFVAAGARVALLDSNERWLAERLAEMRAIGGEHCAMAAIADVTQPATVTGAVRQIIAELGGLHILVNNAGINLRNSGFAQAGRAEGSFWDVSPEAWSQVAAVNFNGPFIMAHAVADHMRAQGWGRIIGITTSFDNMIRGRNLPYGPTKAGHEAFIAALAQDLEGTGVTANVLVPGGATNTNLIARDAGTDFSRFIQPEVMGQPAIWLASEASNGFNGRRIVAYFWDEQLPIEERLAKASWPAGWPELGPKSILPRAR